MIHCLSPENWSKKAASVALVVAVVCFLLYAMACVMSPIAWSPDSSKMALLVTPPGEDPNQFAIFIYDLKTGKRFLLDEAQDGSLLSAPAWSGDGKWIAYYKSVPKPTKDIPSADPLFSEENRMVEPQRTAYDNAKTTGHLVLDGESVAPQRDSDKFVVHDLQLTIVKPDGTSRKILRNLQSQFVESNEGVNLWYMRPQWSKDCQHLFYARICGKLCYIGSYDIEKQKSYAHTFSRFIEPMVSPNNEWIASVWKKEKESDDEVLVIIKTDGTQHKTISVDISEGIFPAYLLTWAPDSKHLVVQNEKSLSVVDIQRGSVKSYGDPNNILAYPIFSPSGNEIYCLGSCQNSQQESDHRLCLKSLNSDNGMLQNIFEMTSIPDLDMEGEKGTLSISPDGKNVVFRTMNKDGDIGGEDRTVLMIWDGTKQRTIWTDRWLLKPLYQEKDLIYDSKLLGTWIGANDTRLVIDGQKDNEYSIKMSDANKTHTLGANLARIQGKMVMGLFLDDPLMSGREVVADYYMILHQIEPSLRIQMLSHTDLAKVLALEPSQWEKAISEDVVEYRLAKPNSKVGE